MKKVIFITTIKPFNEAFKDRQLNAIQSWLLLDGIDKEVHILTSFDIENDVNCLNNIKNNLFVVKDYSKSPYTDIPTYNSMYEIGKSRITSDDDIICTINADIILLNDFSETINSLLNQINSRKFCFVGKRTNWNDTKKIDFNDPDWNKNLSEEINKSGVLDSMYCIDYFISTEQTFSNLPNFFVARQKYDNYLVAYSISNNEYSIDLTNTVKAIHQNHFYGVNGDMDWNDFLKTIPHEHNINVSLSNAFAGITSCSLYSDFENNKIIIKNR